MATASSLMADGMLSQRLQLRNRRCQKKTRKKGLTLLQIKGMTLGSAYDAEHLQQIFPAGYSDEGLNRQYGVLVHEARTACSISRLVGGRRQCLGCSL